MAKCDAELEGSLYGEGSQLDLILAVDLGSSSVRASAYRLDGTRLEETTEFRITEQSLDGTFDPHVLTDLTEEVISDCLARVRKVTSRRPLHRRRMDQLCNELAWRRLHRPTCHSGLHLL